MNSQCLKFFVVGVALNGALGRPSYFADENEYRHRRQNIEVEVAAEYGSNWDVRNVRFISFEIRKKRRFKLSYIFIFRIVALVRIISDIRHLQGLG